MFEYGDFEAMKAMIFLTVVLILWELARNKTKTKKRNIFIYISLAFLVTFLATEHNQSTAQNNISAFKKEDVLECSNLLMKYRVSIKDGWEFEKSYFIKESLMIRADKCEVR